GHGEASENRAEAEEHGRGRGNARGVGGGHAFVRGEVGDGGRHVGGTRPKSDHRDQQQGAVDDRAATEGNRPQRGERLRGGELARLRVPARRFAHAVANERNQQRGRSTDGEDGPPSVPRTDGVVHDRGEERADVVAGVHPRRALASSRFGPLLSDENPADGPLAADPRAREKSKEGELPDAGRDAAEEGEKRIAEDGEYERTDAAEAVGERPPEEREAPPDEEDRKEHASVVADVGGRRLDAGAREQVAEGGDEDERVDEGVHAVEGPAPPRGPESADLVGGEWDARHPD